MDTSLILQSLNEAQRAAVTSPASVVQILAPPGSGKTKTLTSRVAHLLTYEEYKPWNIICVTFTIKSAREMKERIAKLIGDELARKLLLGTFHSVCRRYLVTYGYKIGLKKGFGIADSSDSQAIVGRICKRLKLNIDPKQARGRISSAKAKCQGIEQLRLEVVKSKKQNVDQQEFVRVFEEYEEHLRVSHLLDYDDLLLRCVELLSDHPDCVSNVDAVLIDEFQDTNNVQYRLMNLFAAKNQRITTVGDPDQSIYGWRSAEIQNLARMQKLYPDTLVINLENNYRSSGTILAAASEVIEQDNARPEKPLVPTHGPGTIPTFRKLPSSSAEASWIVTEVIRCTALCGSCLLKYSDFAILLRSAALSRQIESALAKAGIPYRMVGGLRFFDRVEVKILLDYMRVVSQPDNSDALSRILNVPSRGIGDLTTKSLMEEARAQGTTLYKLIKEIIQGHSKSKVKITKNVEQGLSSLYNILMTCRKKLIDEIAPLSPQQLLDLIWNRLRFKEYLEKKYPEDHENRWANVEELIVQAEDLNFMKDELADNQEDALPEVDGVQQDSSHKAEEALTKFLANVALATEIQKDEEINGDTGEPIERVTISTIHAAKGLEWPAVFIPSAYDGSIPHSRAEDCDEERRLLYVAMTRAQALLYISCPTRNTGSEETTPSPFLTTKEVALHLTDQGPCLRTDRAVPDIARILGRNCPSQLAMNEGLDKVQSAEDNLWPLDGTHDAETIAERGLGRTSAYNQGYSIPAKRRKVDFSQSTSGDVHYKGFASARTTYSNLSVTMHNTASFTTKPATGDPISGKLHHLTEQARAVESPRSQARGAKKTVPKSRGLSSQAQRTLAAFLQPKHPHRPTSSAPMSSLQVPITNSRRAGDPFESCRIDGVVPEEETVSLPPPKRYPDAVSRPPTAIPTALTGHSIRPLSTSRPKFSFEGEDDAHTKKLYVFLTSSPPRPTSSHARGDGSEERNEEGAYARSVDRNPDSANTKHVGRIASLTAAPINNFPNKAKLSGSSLAAPCDKGTALRPSSTFHNTSMAQLQARTSSDGVPRKKTLGVRRSMAGWGARADRPFSVPRMGDA